VKYELGVYIPEDDILHSHSRENLRSYKETVLTGDTTDTLCAPVEVQAVVRMRRAVPPILVPHCAFFFTFLVTAMELKLPTFTTARVCLPFEHASA
jgi:hypothetical protein